MLTILYRGLLSSCNYGCHYCPFAKHKETREEHEADAQALARFVDWAMQQTRLKLSIFFTPWGEALIHRRYQQAITQLSHIDHITKIAIQTNISCRMDWLEEADKSKVALWATYHPTEISRERFLEKCLELRSRAIRFSVGSVGLRNNIAEIEALRAELPEDVYLWVNAYDRAKRVEGAEIPPMLHTVKGKGLQPLVTRDRVDDANYEKQITKNHSYYSEKDIQRLNNIDPLFSLNTKRYLSRGKACRTGHTAISVGGDGTMRRCHFIEKPIGNIYKADFLEVLKPRPCSRQFCDCHIGYVHINDLGLYDVFRDGILERIPAGFCQRKAVA